MTTQALPEPGRASRAGQKLLAILLTAVSVAGPALRATAAPTRAHLRDHAYTICGMGFISAASFYHSIFTGLLVTGILFFVYEWKVSEE